MVNIISTTSYIKNNENNRILGTIITEGHYIGTYHRIGDRRQNTIDFPNNRRKINSMTKKRDRYIYEIIYTNPKLKVTTERLTNKKVAYAAHFGLIDKIKNV